MDLEENYVEAIEEGRIVKVTRAHAIREGLVILRQPELKVNKPGETPSFYKKPIVPFNVKSEKKDYRKTFSAIMDRKVGWQERQVINELVENFHWKIKAERRKKNYTRRQLASKMGVSDENLQILESGRLPSNDFVMINKVQEALGVNLRRDGKDFTKSPREMMESTLPSTPKKKDEEKKARQTQDSSLDDEDIEILEEDI